MNSDNVAKVARNPGTERLAMADGYESFLAFDWSDERWRTYLNGLYPPPNQALRALCAANQSISNQTSIKNAALLSIERSGTNRQIQEKMVQKATWMLQQFPVFFFHESSHPNVSALLLFVSILVCSCVDCFD